MTNKFSPGDKIFAVDKMKLYEAKILRVASLNKNKYKYFVHYSGWDEKWDTWIEDTLVVGLNDLKGIEELKTRLINDNKNSKTEKIESNENSSNRKRSNKNSDIKDEQPPVEPEITSSIPLKKSRLGIDITPNGLSNAETKKRNKLLWQSDVDDIEQLKSENNDIDLHNSLKKILVDDWSLICNKIKSTDGTITSKLLNLPREFTVRKIIAGYLQNKGKDNDTRLCNLLEGLRLYFDKALPFNLLYRHEREQYSLFDREDEDISPSDIYGIEHLLRLLVRVPVSLSDISNGPDKKYAIKSFNDFITYLHKNADKFINMSDYCDADEAINTLKSKLKIITEKKSL